MSPQLKSVEMIGQQQLKRKSRPWSITIPDFFEPVQLLRQRFAKLVHASDYRRIAVIPSASYGIATVTQNLPLQAGRKIILMGEQFPSNYYSWERKAKATKAQLQIINAPHGPNRTQNWNEALLEAIDNSTAAVALGHVHWADGTLFDLAAVRARTEEVGALLIIDGTQSVGALPLSITEIRPDALICAGYKWLLGPYSIGLAYYGPAFDKGEPIEENWINRKGSDHFPGLTNYQSEYRELAGRFSVGEQSNFLLVPMLSEAIRQLLEWGPEQIQTYCREIARNAMEQLLERGCTLAPEDKRAHHLVGVRLPASMDMQRLNRRFQAAGVHVSLRGNAIRIAPHLYNSPPDFDRFIACFEGD